MRLILKLNILVVLLLGSFFYAQEKNKFVNTQSVLAKINPNNKVDFWTLLHNDYGRDKEIVTSGSKKEFVSQTSGFNIAPTDDSFYYIVYSKAGKISYITELSALKDFIGKIDNAEEAALSAVLEGYIIDEQFVDVAANYYEDKSNYYLDLGKVTSKECPYQKTHYTLTISKATGAISSVKDNGTYIEVYTKKCSNNPRLQKIEKKEEPVVNPKKQPIKKRK